jgi:hypothetical protein
MSSENENYNDYLINNIFKKAPSEESTTTTQQPIEPPSEQVVKSNLSIDGQESIKSNVSSVSTNSENEESIKSNVSSNSTNSENEESVKSNVSSVSSNSTNSENEESVESNVSSVSSNASNSENEKSVESNVSSVSSNSTNSENEESVETNVSSNSENEESVKSNVSSNSENLKKVPTINKENAAIIPTKFESTTDRELIELWDTTVNFEERDIIVKELQRRNLFPSASLSKWEYETGAYPDTKDPEFLQKLLAKREFAESLQTTWKPRTDPCEDDNTFEVTPVQRFVANFMSPKTPYMSALLFHGVGVGKTCAGVQIIEAWLEQFPNAEVFLIAPPTIQQGFYRTIFDKSKVVIGEGNEPNTASQCTGTTYMKLTNTLYERDINKIEKAVNKAIRRRYKVFGYISFANYIRDILKGIPAGASDTLKAQLKKDNIRKIFSGKLLIVDEAHNLRDIVDEDDKTTGGKAEDSDAAGGKILTPYLRDVLMYSEGMKFCMLTATPMYNTYKEIIFMLNLLLINDKQATITEADIFDKEGNILEEGKKKLYYICQRYVSFMRGENPVSFPVRLFPDNIPSISSYPENNPRGTAIPEDEKRFYKHLPLVPIMLKGDSLKASVAFMNSLPPGKGLSTFALEKLVHAGNIVVPATDTTNGDTLDDYKARTDITGLGTIFSKESSGGEVRYRAKQEGGAKWLGIGELGKYSPKFEFLINRIKTSEGCIFAYTRFVNGGALPLALALEANGYTPWGRKSTLLVNGIQSPGGKQCAMCPRREKEHSGAGHDFSPAYYGILTGDISISPRNEQTIKAQRAFDNADGSKMKIIIGSQIASEGVDLRFVRETHVIDSWFHLNKTEQILGRAIRYLSHCALPAEKRNNTVYLYTSVLPSSEYTNGGRETADLYSYRIGFKKAVLVGNVTRTMKISAIDCNLNNQAIVIKGQPAVRQIDSQSKVRENVEINDMPFTAVCDWIETCDYKCVPEIDVKELKIDDSTYDEYSARWRVNRLKQRIRARFAEQTFYQSEDMWNLLSDVPRLAAVDLLTEIVDNKNFQVHHGELTGYIRYCNGYYIFQPNVYLDLSIPLAIRAAKFPIKRDYFDPIEYEAPEVVEEEERENTTQTIAEIWKAVMEWCQNLSTSPKYIPEPDELTQKIIQLSQDDAELLDNYRKRLEMIQWFYSAFQKSTNKNSESFRKTILFYLWDEYLTLEEQIYLVYSSGLNVLDCIKENQYLLGRYLVNRFMNPKTGEIIFMCEGGKSCQQSIIDEINRDNEDPVRAFKVNVKTTGEPYAIIVPKNGQFVFKTAEPPYEGGKLGKGKECGNVSTKTGHIANLIQIGEILNANGKTNFQLSRENLLSSKSTKGPARICALMDICIRFLDAERIQGKKWFFRPVQSYYTGHKGTSRSGKLLK